MIYTNDAAHADGVIFEYVSKSDPFFPFTILYFLLVSFFFLEKILLRRLLRFSPSSRSVSDFSDHRSLSVDHNGRVNNVPKSMPSVPSRVHGIRNALMVKLA